MPPKTPTTSPAPVDLRHIFEPEFWLRFWQTFSQNALIALLQIGGILLAYLLLHLLLSRLIDSVLARLLAHEARLGIAEERQRRLQTLQGLAKSLVSYVLFFVFGVLFLKALGFDIMPFITTAGVIGVAVAFGSQKLVKDVISGFFIMIDNLFVVGDTVTIGTTTGQVVEMGMRVTRLLDPGGRVVLIANGDIGVVTNLSRNPVSDFVEVAVAAGADLNKVVSTINAVGEALFAQPNHHLKAAPKLQGITAFSAASVTIRIEVVSDPRDLIAEQMRLRGALRESLTAAEIPLA
ncbi:MAG TPA: mechanosensitive ion channel domain-containing protein [Chthonomonadaceae bacterium]|nr:mechanosensitive ion channel domain-containing protein [Chthonomonadaceae bacterium]